MLKFKIIPWLIVITLLITQFSGYEIFQLNQKSLKVSKSLFSSESFFFHSSSDSNFENPVLDCHNYWLGFIQASLIKKEPIMYGASDLLPCSTFHMSMLRKLYPVDLDLATLATQLYPDETAPLYWFVQATDPNISNESKPVIQKILSMTPNDGLAWRYLGIILISEGDIPAAIDAHIKSCNNGDPGYNGCYNAGRLLEEEGEYKDAIFYYRISLWSKSKEAAVKLVARLSKQ